jgi:hypothetical protein
MADCTQILGVKYSVGGANAAIFRFMANRPSTKMYEWRITRILSSPAELIGHVEAPDDEEAIKEAIRQFGITDPQHQKRLAARPMPRAGSHRRRRRERSLPVLQ